MQVRSRMNAHKIVYCIFETFDMVNEADENHLSKVQLFRASY